MKFILYFILFFFLFRFVFRFLLPFFRVTSAAGERMRQMQKDIEQMQRGQENAPQKPRERKQGEYIDFEEVK